MRRSLLSNMVAELTLTGDVVDLQGLLEEHKHMVYRIAYSVLRNHHDAEDAAQETFLKVWRAAHKLSGIQDRKAWVARIAWNAASDRRRGQARGETPLEDLAAAVERRHVQGANAEQIAAGAELQRLLAALIAGLPPKLREVIELSSVQELDGAEMARVLQIAPEKARFRLFQARQLLREKLDRLLGKES